MLPFFLAAQQQEFGKFLRFVIDMICQILSLSNFSTVYFNKIILGQLYENLFDNAKYNLFNSIKNSE